MAEGLRRIGGFPCNYPVTDWPRYAGLGCAHLPDVAVFYGLEGCIPELFAYYRDFRRAAVYIDLGYWGRRDGGRWAGFHKVVVNARHPTAYFMDPERSGDRLERFGLEARPWRDPAKQGNVILLGGMGDKGAAAEGFEPEEWERQTLATIREHTELPVLYRPKPSWKDAKPIQGMGYSSKAEDINWGHLRACVSHHSNLAVDALAEGVGSFCWGGAGQPLSSQDLAQIENPPAVARDERQQLMANLAYCQWNVDEMRRGDVWRFLLEEGLL